MSLNKRPTLPLLSGSKSAAITSGNGSSSEKPASPSIISQFRAQLKKGDLVNWDTSMLAGVVDAVKHSDAIDDRKLLLEHVLSVLAKLPQGPVATKLANSTVELLYNDLSHPPATYLGHQYAWRTADGSNNNVCVPDMGKAGTPYARSVQQSHPLPKSAMPDAGLVFDTLLRRESFEKHPAGLSSLMFGFAALVIHTVFRTSHVDVSINQTSSYVDLSPLYGANQEEQDKIRKRDGRGLLYPDTFAEDRLLLLPPSVCALLVLFNRNHNYIAKKLLEINERDTWVDPDTLSPDDPKKNSRLVGQEEEIFQIARLVNCAWFAAVVFSDYFSCILGLIRQGSSWSLNPFGEIRNTDHSFFGRGQGNACSVEFNCLYRWHATTSAEDEKWIEHALGKVFEGKNLETLTTEDFKGAAKKIRDTQPDIHHWTFGAMSRQEDGTFKDEELANILHNATEHPAGAFRARGTPVCMRPHEMMGIEANRSWGVCSLNDFRKFLGLKTYASFKEWNPNPAIYTTAEKLYGHIDNLELYVGLQAEEAKPVVEGAGLCPGYTISRAILADAIALTRGDRFYTADFTPHNMTAWGFKDCQRDPSGFGFGSTLGRLFLRTLPNQFTHNSVYTWFPLMVPSAMKPHLEKLDVFAKYDMARPRSTKDFSVVSEHAEVAQILKNPATFQTNYSKRASEIITGDGFYIADGNTGRDHGAEIIKTIANDAEEFKNIGEFFFLKTRELIDKHSYANVGGKISNVDLVRDVLNVVPLYWAATEIAGIRLKDEECEGEYSEKEIFDMVGDIYSYIFLEVEPAKLSNAKDKAQKTVDELLKHIKANLVLGPVRKLSVPGLIGSVSRLFNKPVRTDRFALVRRLHELGHEHNLLANSVLAVLVGATVELSLTLTNVMNVFLGDDIRENVGTLAGGSDVDKFSAYVNEAIRLDPPFRGVFRTSTKAEKIGSLSVEKDERIFLDIASANLNESVFPDAKALNATRPKDGYLNADIVTKCLGKDLTAQIVKDIFRGIFSYSNVRRAPGQSGKLARFNVRGYPLLNHAYLDGKQQLSPWPTALVVQYDTPAPEASGSKA